MNRRFSRHAQRDFDARFDELARQGRAVALGFLSDVRAALAFLEAHPHAGRVVHLKQRKAPVRRWNMPPLAIYYDLRGDELLVIRLRHGARRPITRQA